MQNFKRFVSYHPRLSLIIIFLIIIFAFNIALFLPLNFSSILYNLEITILQALRIPIPTWIVLIIMIITLFHGIYFIPRLEIPSTEEKFIYTSTWTDGKLRYFKVFGINKPIAVDEEWIKRIGWKRYILVGNIRVITETDDAIIYESEELEVSQSIELQHELDLYKRKVAQLEEDRKADKIIMTKKELLEFLKTLKVGK